MIINHEFTIWIIDRAWTGHSGMQWLQCVQSDSSTTAKRSERKSTFTGHNAIQAAHP